ncbi:MAG: homocysteine S-methyltransferase family protein, partial [Akkermansiaceae bacterium]
MQDLFSPYPFVLSEAAICERLRRDESITLHPTLFNTPLIYEPAGARVLAGVYHEYIDIARDYALPIVIAAPTWRLDAERVAEAGEPKTINRDAVAFIQRVKQDSGYEHVFVTGLLACKNDCYDPKVALSADEAEDFHSAQASELADAGLDLLTAQTIPAVSEAEGMARAM